MQTRLQEGGSRHDTQHANHNERYYDPGVRASARSALKQRRISEVPPVDAEQSALTIVANELLVLCNFHAPAPIGDGITPFVFDGDVAKLEAFLAIEVCELTEIEGDSSLANW